MTDDIIYVTNNVTEHVDILDTYAALMEKFNFDPEREDWENFVAIPKGLEEMGTDSVDITTLIETLLGMKNRGVTHVQIIDCDGHMGYHLAGLEVRLSTEEEIQDYIENPPNDFFFDDQPGPSSLNA